MFTGGAFGYLTDYVLWWVLCLSLLIHTWCFFRFFPKDRYRKTGLAIGNGLVFVCMLGVAALVAESYFRFICVETDAFGLSLPAQRWFALHTRLNSLGCRDEEWTIEKPEGLRRIAFVGDSFAYGWGIERVEDRFPDLVGAMFNRESPGPVEVMNVAKSGWDTGAQLQPIADMIEVYDVDEVVLCYVANDIEKLLPRTPDFDPIRPPMPKLLNPTTSCLVDYLFYRVWVPQADTVSGYHDWLAEGFAEEATWQRHQQQLYAIIHHCRDHDVALRVVLLPFIRTSGEKFQPAGVHAALCQFFEVNNIQAVDLLPAIAGHDPTDLMVNGHDAHPNELANRLFADAIWQTFCHGTTP